MLEKGSKDELKAYRLDVKRRLEKPFKRRDKEWKKLANQLEPDEVFSYNKDFTFLFSSVLMK